MMKALIGSRLKVTGSSTATVMRRTDAGQHADRRAERDAGERPRQVRQRSAFAKPGAERLECLDHRAAPYNHPARIPAGSESCSTRAKSR